MSRASAHSLLATVALLGGVALPARAAPEAQGDSTVPRFPRQGDPCPKCKRGKVRHGGARFNCTRYCHRCGWFVTDGQVTRDLRAKGLPL